MEKQRTAFFVIIILILIIGVFITNQTFWILDNLLILAGVYFLFLVKSHLKFSKISYFLIFFYLVLVAIGTYYGCTESPIGFWLQNLFGLERNPYDRIIHFGFGLLLYYPIYEIFKRSSNTSNKFWLYFVPFILIVGAGGFYEVTEWAKAINVDAQNAELILGMQGDKWDAQKDILFETIGGALAMLATLLFKNGKENETNTTGS